MEPDLRHTEEERMDLEKVHRLNLLVNRRGESVFKGR